MRSLCYLAAALAALGCAHRLSGADLDRVARPAFLARIDDEAGPRSRVFRDDGAYRPKLKKLDVKEADRLLKLKLVKGASRFEVSERLRAATLAGLSGEPWKDTVDPAAVASALQSFLVEEVPANAPDYERLRQLGADAVVELVVEDYGMRSAGGKAGVYVRGHARMFLLPSGDEIWSRSFEADDLQQGRPHLDPFAVGKDPSLYKERMAALLDGIAQGCSKDLSPQDRRAKAPRPTADEAFAPADDVNRAGKELPPPEDELPPGELPEPDSK